MMPVHGSGTKDIRYFIGTLDIWKYSKGYFAELKGFKVMVEK
jgi:hypothetical protein